MTLEKDIVHENGDFWVLRNRAKRSSYDVMKNLGTHSMTFQSFAFDADGMSLAIAYCDYNARKASK